MLDTYNTISFGNKVDSDSIVDDNDASDSIVFEKIADYNYIMTNGGHVMSYQNSIKIPKYALLDIFHNTNNLSKYKNQNFKFDEINPNKFANDFEEFCKKTDSQMNIDTLKLKLINNLKFRFEFKKKSDYDHYFKSDEFSDTFTNMMETFYQKEINNKNMEIKSTYLIITNVMKKSFIDKITSEHITDSSFKQLNVNSFYLKDYMTKLIQKTFDEIITRKNNFFDSLMKKVFILESNN
jgi:hypothetical protein